MGVLSVERFEQAYAATGLIPEQLHAVIVEGKCCVIGAIYAADTGERVDDNGDATPIYDYADKEFGRHASIGLRSGFDGKRPEIGEYYGAGFEEYLRGYIVGKSAMEKLKPGDGGEVVAKAVVNMMSGRSKLT